MWYHVTVELRLPESFQATPFKGHWLHTDVGREKTFDWLTDMIELCHKTPVTQKVRTELRLLFIRLSLSTPNVVVLLFYVHGKHLRSCRDGQLT